MKYDYLIVGAGLFGATFANLAASKGKKVCVIEQRDHIGGNAHTEEIAGIQVHRYGAHIFHTKDRVVWDYVNRFAEFDPFVHSPVADYHGKRYPLPFNLNTFSAMWGVETAEDAEKIIIAQSKEITGRPHNLEEQAIALVGWELYEKLIKGYTEKQWGRPCDQLQPDIICRIPVRYTRNNNYFNDPYQGIPRRGYTTMVEKMLSGIEVHCGEAYEKDRYAADKIIYTGAIDVYYDYCFGRLAYRSLRFETDILDQPDFQGCAVVNYTDRETPYTRIIEHQYFEPGRQHEQTVVTREIPCLFEGDNEPYYPINNARNNAIYQQYKQRSEAEGNIFFGGRLCEYRYYDMDQTIAAAMRLADGFIDE